MNSPSSPGTSGVVVSVPNSPSSISGGPPSADATAAAADVFAAAAAAAGVGAAPKVNIFDPGASASSPSFLRHEETSWPGAQTGESHLTNERRRTWHTDLAHFDNWTKIFHPSYELGREWVSERANE